MADRKAFVTETTTTVRGKSYPRFVVVYWTEDGTRKRASRKTRKEAETLASQFNRDAAKREARNKIKRRYLGEEDAKRFPEEKYRDAVEALAILEGAATLTEAARFLMEERARKAKDIPTVSVLVEDYIKDAESRNLRERTIGDLRHRMNRIVERFGDTRVDEVSTTDVREWVEELTKRDGTPVSLNTRNHYRFAIQGLFDMAVKKEYIEANPANKTAQKKDNGTNDDEPGILTVDQARKLLHKAAEDAPEAVPCIALGLFAGTRTAEILRLDWSKVDLGAGIIKISARVAKKRAARNTDILPCLMKWLLPYHKTEGKLWPYSQAKWTKTLSDLAGKAGIEEWPHNALRHSFASYHVALHEDPSKTAWMMGHRDSVDVLFESYRQLTSETKAEEFFAIEPPK